MEPLQDKAIIPDGLEKWRRLFQAYKQKQHESRDDRMSAIRALLVEYCSLATTLRQSSAVEIKVSGSELRNRPGKVNPSYDFIPKQEERVQLVVC